MNKLPIWRLGVMIVALLFGLIYTLPNFFGEVPAIQVSSARATIKVDQDLSQRVARALDTASVSHESPTLEGASIGVRLPDTDTQLKAPDVTEKAPNPDAADAP